MFSIIFIYLILYLCLDVSDLLGIRSVDTYDKKTRTNATTVCVNYSHIENKINEKSNLNVWEVAALLIRARYLGGDEYIKIIMGKESNNLTVIEKGTLELEVIKSRIKDGVISIPAPSPWINTKQGKISSSVINSHSKLLIPYFVYIIIYY